MPFHSPIPDSKPPGPKRTPGLNSYVQAERLMQIAFVLPCALLIGWGAGWCFDHFLHTRWGTAIGLVLGIVAGMTSVIRTAMDAMNSVSSRKQP